MLKYSNYTRELNIINNSPFHSKPCTYIYLKTNCLEKYDPWSVILTAKVFVVQSTYHTNLQAMPGQLVFIRDMVLNTPFIAD